MSGGIRPRNTNRGIMRKCVCRRALAFLAITFAGFSTPFGNAQTLRRKRSNLIAGVADDQRNAFFGPCGARHEDKHERDGFRLLAGA
jgi:DNA-binding LacI/PurR family transcriptional regulator